MNQIKNIAGLSREQHGQWNAFQQNWDKFMAEAYKDQWGQRFAEAMQYIMQQLNAGNDMALSNFMYVETTERLTSCLTLDIPEQLHSKPQVAYLEYV